MATFYNRSVASVPTTDVLLFTSQSNSTIVLSILVANKNGTSAADVTCSHRLSNGSTINNYIAYTIPVPADSNVDLLSNKYIIPSGEKIYVTASSSGYLDIAVSYVEV